MTDNRPLQRLTRQAAYAGYFAVRDENNRLFRGPAAFTGGVTILCPRLYATARAAQEAAKVLEGEAVELISGE